MTVYIVYTVDVDCWSGEIGFIPSPSLPIIKWTILFLNFTRNALTRMQGRKGGRGIAL